MISDRLRRERDCFDKLGLKVPHSSEFWYIFEGESGANEVHSHIAGI